MIDSNYLKYISDHKNDECHKNLITDFFYFYYGIKPYENQTSVCMTNNIFDLSKENLKLE